MDFIALSLLKAALWAAIILTTLAYLQWVERKVIAHIQVRVGPSRVGPHGLLQPLADVIKLLTKEDMVPQQANKLLYVLAPFLAVSMVPVGQSPAHSPQPLHDSVVTRRTRATRLIRPSSPPKGQR